MPQVEPEIADKIRAWGKDAQIIACHRVSLCRSDASCELCERWIAALPESRMKARQPGWHLICKECLNRFFPEIKQHGGDVKFMGRFKTSEQAKKVLPR